LKVSHSTTKKSKNGGVWLAHGLTPMKPTPEGKTCVICAWTVCLFVVVVVLFCFLDDQELCHVMNK
jgi:hypothetical protein